CLKASIHVDALDVRVGDGARVAIEIEEADRIDDAARVREHDVPIDLIDEAVPSESDDGHAALAHQLHVVPLSPEPRGAATRVDAVRLRVHERAAVTLPILRCDDEPS